MAEESKFRIPSVGRSRLASSQAGAGPHPDANVLSAFAENSLTPAEQKNISEHLAQCPECRGVLDLSSVEIPGHSAPFMRPRWGDQPSRGNLLWTNLRWGALAALAAVFFAVIAWPNLRSRQNLAAVNIAPNTQTATAAPSVAAKTAAPKIAERSAVPYATSVDEVAPAKAKPGTSSVLADEKSQVAAKLSYNAKQDLSLNKPAQPSLHAEMDLKKAGRDDSFDKISILRHPEVASSPSPPPRPAPVAGVSNANIAQSGAMREVAPAASRAAEETRKDSDSFTAGKAASTGAAESVEVTAQAPAAKSALRAQNGFELATTVPKTLLNSSWRTHDGRVQQSINSGRSWIPVEVAQGARFQAIASAGALVWVGSSKGVLYHSSDGGATWSVQWSYFRDAVQKNPSRYPNSSATIIKIDFSDANYGGMRVKIGGSTPQEIVFNSGDGGKTWREETID